jgi:hypothetical protein
MANRWTGSVIGKSPSVPRGIWNLFAHSVYRGSGAWPIPLTVTGGLILHIDASLASSVTLNGSSVSAITDLSPSAYTIDQTTAANQPSYVTGERNGRNVLRFNAASSHFLNTSSITIPSSYTSFRVFRRDAFGIHSHGIGNSSGSPNDRYDAYWFTDNNTYQKSNASATTHGSANTSTGWFYVTTRRNGTSSVLVRRNGSSVANITSGTGVTNAASGSWSRIGSANDGSTIRFTEGDIGELLIYDRSLSDQEVTDVESYLSGKWGF